MPKGEKISSAASTGKKGGFKKGEVLGGRKEYSQVIGKKERRRAPRGGGKGGKKGALTIKERVGG